MTSKSPVGDASVATLVRTDTALDRRQKVKKVCRCRCIRCCVAPIGLQGALLHASARRQVCLRRARQTKSSSVDCSMAVWLRIAALASADRSASVRLVRLSSRWVHFASGHCGICQAPGRCVVSSSPLASRRTAGQLFGRNFATAFVDTSCPHSRLVTLGQLAAPAACIVVQLLGCWGPRAPQKLRKSH